MSGRLKYCSHCEHKVSERTYRRHREQFGHIANASDNAEISDALSETPDNNENIHDEHEHIDDYPDHITIVEGSDTQTRRKQADFIEFFREVPYSDLKEDVNINTLEHKIVQRWEEMEDDIEKDYSDTHTGDIDRYRFPDISNVFITIIHWVMAFLGKWSVCYNISSRCLDSLLAFIKCFVKALGMVYHPLMKMSDVLPGSMHQFNKIFGTLDDDFIKLVVCPTCHATSNYNDCVSIINGKKQSSLCSYTEFPSHPHAKKRRKCGTPLLKEVLLKSNKHYLYPRKIFCIRKIESALKLMLDRPGFFNMCERWRDRQIIPGTYRDVYDGRVWKSFMNYKGRPFLEIPGNFALMMNLDWFQPFKNSPYSVGAIYFTLMNLPRDKRFLKVLTRNS